MLVQPRLTEMIRRAYARLRVFLIFAIFALPIVYQPAKGQESFPLPTLELPKPGVAEGNSSDVMPPGGTLSDKVLSAHLVGRALISLFQDSVPHTRGAQDVSLFRNDAPSVVLILTKDGLGSGSLLNDGSILTNRHVVGNERQVTVVFKPSDPSGKARTDEVVQAVVIKLDVQRDLTLLHPASIPPRHGIDISTEDGIDVGTDVAAIGHPNEQAWTLTKGIVSAFRPDYEWSAGPNDDKHVATVIQTQTPINPGNSGGPLLTEDGKIVGVSSFRTKGAEGLNFAVAAKEIRIFLANPDNGMQKQNTCVEAKTIYEGRNDDNTAFIRTISLRCDNQVDIVIFIPDNKREPVYALVDSKRRGKADGIVYDSGRSGKWTTSFWDVNFDGTFPLKGLHPDGKLVPTSYVQRCGGGQKPVKDFKCA